jgi:putative inorganic carbon (HCO3(-)) transporter
MGNRLKYSTVFKEKFRVIGAATLAIVFLIISLSFIRTGASLLWLIPPALLIGSIALLAIDRFLLLTVSLVPVSVQLRFIFPDSSADIFLPTELMLAIILLLMIFKLIFTREIDRKILLHPVSIVSFCMLGWYLITSLTGTMPLVSLKSFLTRLWFFTGFFLLAAEIFRKPERIKNYFFAFIAGMIPVVIWFLIRMLQNGAFDQRASYFMIRPLFNDHTSFGAALAFCIPVIICFLTMKETGKRARLFLFIALFLFSASFLFSYSRAAWLSLALSAIIMIVIMMKISWKIILPGLVIAGVIVSLSWSAILFSMNENKQESSDNIESHFRSITNIRTDASNLERINRWKSAIRMFRERPVLGWGPATYQFQYAPFQISTEKTTISTNYGEGGNAHSEYLGALVDSGVFGLLIYVLLLFISIGKGIIIWSTHKDKQVRNLALALVTGIFTYVIHGGLNNFLDTDKITVLFWGMIAAIVAIDIRMKEEVKTEIISDLQ